MLECVQEPGDTVFVPPGWFAFSTITKPISLLCFYINRFHTVLNLDFSVAMTHNVLLPSTLSNAWPQVFLYKKMQKQYSIYNLASAHSHFWPTATKRLAAFFALFGNGGAGVT
jgi:hypothetical protein